MSFSTSEKKLLHEYTNKFIELTEGSSSTLKKLKKNNMNLINENTKLKNKNAKLEEENKRLKKFHTTNTFHTNFDRLRPIISAPSHLTVPVLKYTTENVNVCANEDDGVKLKSSSFYFGNMNMNKNLRKKCTTKSVSAKNSVSSYIDKLQTIEQNKRKKIKTNSFSCEVIGMNKKEQDGINETTIFRPLHHKTFCVPEPLTPEQINNLRKKKEHSNTNMNNVIII